MSEEEPKKKATVDDLVQEMKWLNENVAQLVAAEHRKAKSQISQGNGFSIAGGVLIVLAIGAAMLFQMMHEQAAGVAALKGLPEPQQNGVAVGVLFLLGVASLFYGWIKHR